MIKGNYEALIGINFHIDENTPGILPFEELNQAMYCELAQQIEKMIQGDIVDPRIGSVTVKRLYTYLYREAKG